MDISQVPLLLCSFTLIILQCTNVSTVLLEVFTRVGVDAWALGHRLKVFSEVNIYGHWAKCTNAFRLPFFFFFSFPAGHETRQWIEMCAVL